MLFRDLNPRECDRLTQKQLQLRKAEEVVRRRRAELDREIDRAYWNGASVTDIASYLGLSRESVYKAIQRAATHARRARP